MNALWSALYSKLAGGTALTSLVGGTANPRIYYMQAPENATAPYVVFSLQSGVEPNDNPNRVKDELLFVRGYSPNALTAGNVDAAVDGILDMSTLSVTGWTTIWLAREQDLELVENAPNGSAVYMAGGFYRLEMEQN